MERGRRIPGSLLVSCLTLFAPPVDRVLGPLSGDEGEVVYNLWLMARLVLLPKKV